MPFCFVGLDCVACRRTVDEDECTFGICARCRVMALAVVGSVAAVLVVFGDVFAHFLGR